MKGSMSATKVMIPQRPLSLRQSFTDANYAWDLLEAQVRLQGSQIETITGEDISNLLQLYMRGVQRMNSLVDMRQSFFKNKVTSLMSKTAVIRILNKPMIKKGKPGIVDCVGGVGGAVGEVRKEQINCLGDVVSPSKMMKPMKELELKQKKQSMEMRLAYSAQENNQDRLKKLMAEHNQKESFIAKKIDRIVDSHEEKLRKRINDRKMKTLTCKSKSEVFTEDQTGGVRDFDIDNGDHENVMQIQDKRVDKGLGNFNKIEVDLKKHETENNNPSAQRKSRKLRRISSLESKRKKLFSNSPTDGNEPESPTRRKISKMSVQQSKIVQIKKYADEVKQRNGRKLEE